MHEVIISFNPGNLSLLPDTHEKFKTLGCVGNVDDKIHEPLVIICDEPHNQSIFFVEHFAKTTHHLVVVEPQNLNEHLAIRIAELIDSISFPKSDCPEPLTFELLQGVVIPDVVHEECHPFIPRHRKYFVPRKSPIIPSVRCLHREYILPRKILED